MNPKKLVAWFLAAALVACGGSDGDPTPAPTPPLPEGQNITIIGKVVAPDLSTPIANVVVYVEGALPATSGTPVQAVGALACGSTPDPTWAGSCTAADGSFALSIVTPANAKLAVSKGAFRSTRTLKGYPKNGQFDAGLVSIAAGIGVDGEAPRMAVVTGAYDSIEDVLAKLGFGELENGRLRPGTERFTIFQGTGTSTGGTNVSALFEDRDGSGRIDLFDYAIVFINCGASEMRTLIENAAVRQAVRAYVEGGGRLYVSDQSYDVVEQSFPEFIDFLGSNGTPAATAEALFAATQGTGGITVEAQVIPALQTWLQGVTCAGGPCVQANARVHIEGLLGGWAVMDGVHTGANVTTLVSGAVSYNGGTNVVKPLTMSFAVGSGRVTYTSYHNEAELGDALKPQQRILQYLVFEL